jgi:seryl-tRNA synthetase
MLDIKFIRENLDVVRKAVDAKHLSETVDVDKVIKLDKDYLSLLRNVETHRNLRNEYSNDIAMLIGKKREELIEKAKVVKEDLEKLEKEMGDVKNQLDQMLLLVPNIIAPDVPEGKDEKENVVVRNGEIPKNLNFSLKIM